MTWTTADSEAFLRDSRVFAGLNDEERSHLVEQSEVRAFSKDQLELQRGEQGNSMFLVVQGSIRLVLEGPKKEQDLGLLGPGDFFGEIGMLTQSRRTATATAQTDCILLELPAADIKALFAKHPEIKSRITRTGVERSQDSLKRMLDD